MPSPEMYATTLKQAAQANSPTPQDLNQEPAAAPSPGLTADDTVPKQPSGLKLPHLRADNSETPPPANENNTLMLIQSWQRRKQILARQSKSHLPFVIMFSGAIVSMMWFAAASVYVHNVVGWQNIKTLMPHEIGGFIAGLLMPVALFWMVLTFWLRSVDVKLYAEALREEIQGMIFPSDEADRRVNNDIERLMRQTAEMSRAMRIALGTLQQARQAMRSETQALQKGTEATSERLETLSQQLAERQENLTELQRQFSVKGESFEKASAQLVRDAYAFDTLIQKTAGTAETIGQTLQDPLQKFSLWQNDIVDTLNSALAKINDKQDALRVDAAAIEAKAMTLADALQSGTERLYDYSDEALDKAKLIETRLQGQRISLEETMRQISEQTQTLADQRDAVMGMLELANDRGRAQLAEQVSLLTQTASQLESVQSETGRTIQSIRADLSDTVDQVRNAMIGQHIQTKDFVDNLVEKSRHAMNERADQFIDLQKNLATLVDGLADRGRALGDTGEKTVDTLQAVHDALQKGLDDLTSKTTHVQNGIAAARSALAEPVYALEQAAQSAHDKAQVIGNLFDQRIGTLNQLGEGLTKNAATISTDLLDKSRVLETVLATLQTDIRSLNNDLATQNGLLNNAVLETMSRTDALIPQLTETRGHFEVIQKQIDKTHGQLNTLDEAVTQSGQRWVTMANTSIGRVQQSIESYQDLQQRYETIQKAAVDQFDQAKAHYQQSLDEYAAGSIKAAEEIDHVQHHYRKLGDILQSLQQQAVASEQAIQAANDRAADTQANLAQSVRLLQEQTASSEQDIRTLQQTMEQSADAVAEQAARVSGAMASANEQALTVLRQADRLNQTVTQNVDTLQHASARLEGTLRQAGQSFDVVTEIDTRMKSLDETLQTQRNALQNQTADINDTVASSVERLQQQTQALSQAVYAAGQQSDALRQQEQSLQRDYFFSASKFIVESLHSLALDFTRMLEGELPEKTWKAYQRGETSVFAKRLVANRDTVSSDKIRQKFVDDAEFRTYVQRYMRQFEEIHEQAKKQDYSDLLSSVFISSDVGRLYQLLKSVVES